MIIKGSGDSNIQDNSNEDQNKRCDRCLKRKAADLPENLLCSLMAFFICYKTELNSWINSIAIVICVSSLKDVVDVLYPAIASYMWSHRKEFYNKLGFCKNVYQRSVSWKNDYCKRVGVWLNTTGFKMWRQKTKKN